MGCGEAELGAGGRDIQGLCGEEREGYAVETGCEVVGVKCDTDVMSSWEAARASFARIDVSTGPEPEMFRGEVETAYLYRSKGGKSTYQSAFEH